MSERSRRTRMRRRRRSSAVRSSSPHQPNTQQTNKIEYIQRRRYDDEPRTYKSSYRGTNRRDSRSVRFESDEEEDRDDSPVRTSRPMTPYPEPTTIQRDESIRLFQDLQRKKRKYRKISLPSIPKEVIMGRRTYLEQEERTRRISRRVQNRLKLQEPVTFTLVRDEKGKLGVKMDRELNITKVEKFAAKCGASIGQKIIEFNGIPVVTKKDVLNAMKKTGGSKAKKCKLTIVFDSLAQTELRADELSQLSYVKVKVPLYEMPQKIEMDLYPSRPDRQNNHRIESAGKRVQFSEMLKPIETGSFFLNQTAPLGLEAIRPVSPLTCDTLGSARAKCSAETKRLRNGDEVEPDDPIRVHTSPIVIGVEERPGSPTNVISPSSEHVKRQVVLSLVERVEMSKRKYHGLNHEDLCTLLVEKTHEKTHVVVKEFLERSLLSKSSNDEGEGTAGEDITILKNDDNSVSTTTTIRGDIKRLRTSIQRARERIASIFAETYI